jgi:hypothetical protein
MSTEARRNTVALVIAGLVIAWDGCWHATQLPGVRGVQPADESGCVDLWDY